VAYVLDVWKTIALKENLSYPHFARTRVLIPAKTKVDWTVTLPKEEAWLVTHEVRGDIPYNVFKEWCVKDGMPIFPLGVLMGRDLIGFQISYPIPILVERWIRFSAENTDTVDHYYEMSVFYGVIPKTYLKRLKEQIRVEEEVLRTFLEVWKGLSPAEKVELVKRAPEIPLILMRR